MLSELAYKYKNIFFFILLLVIIGGVYSFLKISKLEDPEITVMQAVVVTIYPGGSAHDVELFVTDILEKEIRTMDGIQEIRSSSVANVSQINVLLNFSVDDKDIPQHWDMLRRKVSGAIQKLPSSAMTPMVLDDIGDVFGIFYAMTGDGLSYDEMNEYAELVKKNLLATDGVKKVEIFGHQPSEISIELSKEKVSEMGIYPAQLVFDIRNYTQPVYSGNYTIGGQSIRMNVNGQANSVEEIKNIPIRGYEGDWLRLKDIATVSKKTAEPQRFNLAYDKKPALGISISMESGKNIIELGELVEEKIENITPLLPLGVTFNKVFFQPKEVSGAIHGFMINLILSVVIVVLVLVFSMGFRSGLIIGAGLILTILASFPILYLLDGTLQRISLGAFVIAMGMLVDNAIVIMDGILIDAQSGKPVRYALFNTPKKTSSALLGATLIAILAFVPVYFSPDTAGTYIGDLFVVLCISLGISWLFALTQVPIFTTRLINLKKLKKDTVPFDSKFYQVMRRGLKWTLNHKLATGSLALFLTSVAIWGITYTNQTFFPDFTYPQAFIEYKLPPQSNNKQVMDDLNKITSDLLNIDGITHVIASHGMTPSRYCLVRPFNQGGDNYGELIVDFKSYDDMIELREKIEDYLRTNYPDAYSRLRTYNLSILSSHTVEVEFSGPDPAVLRKLTKQAEDIMRKSDEIDPFSVGSNWENNGKVLLAKYLPAAATVNGSMRLDVSNSLLAAADGLPIGNFQEGHTSYPIVLKTRESDGSRIENLDNIPVWNLIPNFNALNKDNINGLVLGTKTRSEITKEIVSPIVLNQIAKGLSLESEEYIIQRMNGQRAMQAQCDPKRTSSPAQARASILKEIESIEVPDGYSKEWIGEYKLQSTALKNIIDLLPIAATLILLVLVVLFNSIRKPLIVLLCLPITFIGITPGLILLSKPYSFLAIVGTIGMAGMMIKNSIVLIEEIEIKTQEGLSRYNAILEATIARTRPVMMASITTILGMIPLLPDPMYGPMAVTIMCGLFIGTIVTLFLVPLFYALFFRIKCG